MLARDWISTTAEKLWSPRKCPTGGFKIPAEMITKLFHILFSSSPFIGTPNRFQTRFEWQSEFLFVPAKPALRYDTIRRPMTGGGIERRVRNADSCSI
jgi:hypothetical protein